MKKISLAVIIGLISISLAGCTNSSVDNTTTGSDANITKTEASNSNQSNTTNNGKITLEQAKEIAVKHAGLTKDQVEFFESKSDLDDGREKYDIKFYCNGKEYEYEINAIDGTVIQSEKEVESDISSNNTSNHQTEISTVTNNTTEVATESYYVDNSQNNRNTTAQNNTVNSTPNTSSISLERAKEIALSHAGLSSSEVTFVEAKKDYDHGIEKYEIEFYCNGTEYDYEINAANGQIIKYDYDIEGSYTPPNNSAGNSNSAVGISAERAKEIALSHAGLTSGQVTFKKTELDFDDGIKKYEVEFYYNNREYSYEINANNGNILSYEVD